jgi:hypothetical protein
MLHVTSGRHDFVEAGQPMGPLEIVLPDGTSRFLDCPPGSTVGQVKRVVLRVLRQEGASAKGESTEDAEAEAVRAFDVDGTDDVVALREALRAAQRALQRHTLSC